MNKAQAHMALQVELERLQQEMSTEWLDKSLPEGWKGLDFWDPVEPPKTRVTLRLDKEVVAWFRKMGPGYTRRINRVLRVYYCGVVAGDIPAYPGDHTIPRLIVAAHDAMENR